MVCTTNNSLATDTFSESLKPSPASALTPTTMTSTASASGARLTGDALAQAMSKSLDNSLAVIFLRLRDATKCGLQWCGFKHEYSNCLYANVGNTNKTLRAACSCNISVSLLFAHSPVRLSAIPLSLAAGSKLLGVGDFAVSSIPAVSALVPSS